ncbi:hypothetical protein OIB37_11075 [Streptomyces sp. NBC_00820]|nr:hypothetical protein OIB37_11075 [Streptomyces sp. NBC_00820]
MSAPTPTGRLGHAPVVLSGGEWWLVSEAGSVLVTDSAFSDDLRGFAAAMAAADQAVAGLRAPQGSSAGGRR